MTRPTPTNPSDWAAGMPCWRAVTVLLVVGLAGLFRSVAILVSAPLVLADRTVAAVLAGVDYVAGRAVARVRSGPGPVPDFTFTPWSPATG